jgi:PiT family inorganic phosphate transporter
LRLLNRKFYFMIFDLETGTFILLLISLLAACGFEFVNGFHDTANAVATVIYTNSLKPWQAVMWSGICNFIGVFIGGISVAMGIINLLPIEAFAAQDVGQNVAMILSLLLSAIIWNLGTWYFGLPSSSSHTLIGSILGVGLAYSWLNGSLGAGVNWDKAKEIMLFLIISPIFGFTMAILLMKSFQKFIKSKNFFSEPPKDSPPPTTTRLLSILTSTLISVFHGSNDGQKGVGLVMLILISIVPTHFAINKSLDIALLQQNLTVVENISTKINVNNLDEKEKTNYDKAKTSIVYLQKLIQDNKHLDTKQDFQIRSNLQAIQKGLGKIGKVENNGLSEKEQETLSEHLGVLKEYFEYAPKWVIFMISISLGLGTMIGWKRIVVTIGEKIGKSQLTYAQGSSAEMIAATTIGMASQFGVPVSTTHVLSSAVAGSMFAAKGSQNLQPKTLKNIAMAWILTLPVSIALAAGLFFMLRQVF